MSHDKACEINSHATIRVKEEVFMPEIQETPSAKQEKEDTLHPLILSRLFKIARDFENQGNVHQAIG